MILSQELREQVEKLSRSKTPASQNEIYQILINAIQEHKTTPEDIWNYRNHQFNDKRYVIAADTLSHLGAYLSRSDHKKYAKQFLELAAERGSAWGYRNVAHCSISGNEALGFPPAKERALEFAERAVELTKTSSTPHIHKLILAQALRANSRAIESSARLAEYLDVYCRESGKNFSKENIESGITFLVKCIKEYEDAIRSGATSTSQKTVHEILTEINNFLEKKLDCSSDKVIKSKLYELQQSLYYLRGYCLECLMRKPEAMLAYCEVKDPSHTQYSFAVAARARLIKDTVTQMLFPPEISPKDNPVIAIVEQLASTNISAESQETLPSIVEIFLEENKFARYWGHSGKGFDFVRQSKQSDAFRKAISEIDTLIHATEIEIQIFDNKLQKLPKAQQSESNVFSREIAKSIAEKKEKLTALKQAKAKLEKDYQAHIPSQRLMYRRAKSEANFLNSDRFKNKKPIAELTYQIIDQRFGLTDVKQPVNLTGVSTRLLAAAEKMFQRAVIHLTGADKPQTGIPIYRAAPWNMGYSSGSNNFGPRESYLIGGTHLTYEHRVNPKSQRLGDSFSPDHSTYDNSIYPFLRKLTKEDPGKEKQVARMLINFGKKLEPVSLEVLRQIYPEATEADIHEFTKVSMLIMAKEQVQWLSATDDKFRGLTIVHAKCLRLIENGLLTLAEVFQNNGLFSVYANQSIIYDPSRLVDACERIDKLYGEYLKTFYAEDHCRLFRFQQRTRESLTEVETRQQLRSHLLTVYGGDDESDGEGYESDLEFPESGSENLNC